MLMSLEVNEPPYNKPPRAFVLWLEWTGLTIGTYLLIVAAADALILLWFKLSFDKSILYWIEELAAGF